MSRTHMHEILKQHLRSGWNSKLQISKMEIKKDLTNEEDKQNEYEYRYR